MKLLAPICVCLFLSGCAAKITPIKGKYLDKPFQEISSSPVPKVWDKIIDFFAQQGISIKIIDRSSGLIISEKTRLLWSREDKEGVLIKKDAHIVIERVYDPGSRKFINPAYVTGEWNIRIKESEGGKTLINVNLINVVAHAEYLKAGRSGRIEDAIQIESKSTGNFERQIFEIIK